MKLRTLIAAVLAVSLAGCADITQEVVCPANSIGVSFALAGSTVGNQAIAMLGAYVSAGKAAALAKEGVASVAPVTGGKMSYKYLPIFGADSGSLTCVMPQQQNVIVTSPPASVVQ